VSKLMAGEAASVITFVFLIGIACKFVLVRYCVQRCVYRIRTLREDERIVRVYMCVCVYDREVSTDLTL
jgi:type IV secretory pathway TrbD component